MQHVVAAACFCPLQFMLTDEAKRLLFSPNAGGSSENSEAVSAEVLQVRPAFNGLRRLSHMQLTPAALVAFMLQICLGARLLYTETEVQYECHSSIMDYVSEIGGMKVRGCGTQASARDPHLRGVLTPAVSGARPRACHRWACP